MASSALIPSFAASCLRTSRAIRLSSTLFFKVDGLLLVKLSPGHGELLKEAIRPARCKWTSG